MSEYIFGIRYERLGFVCRNGMRAYATPLGLAWIANQKQDTQPLMTPRVIAPKVKVIAPKGKRA